LIESFLYQKSLTLHPSTTMVINTRSRVKDLASAVFRVFIEWFVTIADVDIDDAFARELRAVDKSLAVKAIACIRTARLSVAGTFDQALIPRIAAFHKAIFAAPGSKLKKQLVLDIGDVTDASAADAIMRSYVDHATGSFVKIDGIRIRATPDAMAPILKLCGNLTATPVRSLTLAVASGGMHWYRNGLFSRFLEIRREIMRELASSAVFENVEELRVENIEETNGISQPLLEMEGVRLESLRRLTMTRAFVGPPCIHKLMANMPQLERLEAELMYTHILGQDCMLPTLKELVLASGMALVARRICDDIMTLLRVFPNLEKFTHPVRTLFSSSHDLLADIVALCQEDDRARRLLESSASLRVAVNDLGELEDVARRFPALTTLPVRCEWGSTIASGTTHHVVHTFRQAHAADERLIGLLDSSGLC
jgi:hypothetical protein